MPSGDPTPLLGFDERLGIGAWLVWLAVLAVALRRQPVAARGEASSHRHA